MSLALIAALPFLGALLPALMIRAGRDAATLSTAAATGLALLLVLVRAPAVLHGAAITEAHAWLPQIGLSATFRLDALGLLFALLILGIGLLILLYARYYLDRRDSLGRFLTYLMLFQGAMLGIVLSGNVLLLLVFWEMTSLASFLLIGYWRDRPDARQGARMALAVTGAGGFCLIAGMLVLGHIVGSYELADILAAKDVVQASPLYVPALVLIVLGAFTKSAQVPFQFWLPDAMAAPTPVSAYLHSATMVKAGLFLLARLWPVLAGTEAWFYIVATTGVVTMILGALVAFFKDDLKALLAYSTVSHLGFIAMLLGFGTKAAALAAVFHVLNHAMFKATLFMTAGIVDHAAHTRDVRRLGGLARLMPLTFVLTTLAALSMAGIPLLSGYLSKELMLEAAVETTWGGSAWAMAAAATLGALLSVAYAYRLVVHTFLGEARTEFTHAPHDPALGLWLAPGVLTALVVAIGVFPEAIAGPLVHAAAASVTGTEAEHHALKIWHGLTPAFWLSLAAILGGAVLLALHAPLAWVWARVPRPHAKPVFDALVAAFAYAGGWVSNELHDGSSHKSLAVLALASAVTGIAAFATGDFAPGARTLLPVTVVPAIGWILLMVSTGATVVFHRQRLLALVLVGVVGLIVSLGFAYLSAPDLALTQISVEVVTIVLLLLALNFLPKQTPRESAPLRRIRDGAVAIAGGGGLGALVWFLMTRDMALPSIAGYHLANSYTGGGGHNVVNVILVDFRGYDTYGEITVLGIAALTIFAIAEALLTGPVSRRLRAWRHDQGRAGDRHPLMLVVATRVVFPVALLVGVFIFLRGHNEPGGGFIAGLVVAIAVLMQYMASGFGWAFERQKIEYHSLIAAGVLLAGLTGAGAWVASRPFLTSAFGYVKLPGLEKFELATAMAFDAGVFLTVLGAVMLALGSLSRIARRAGETVNDEAMDIDPSRSGPGGDRASRGKAQAAIPAREDAETGMQPGAGRFEPSWVRR